MYSIRGQNDTFAPAVPRVIPAHFSRSPPVESAVGTMVTEAPIPAGFLYIHLYSSVILIAKKGKNDNN